MHMKAIVPMLVMVVTVFILCWTPILIFEVIKMIIIPRLLLCLGAPGLLHHRGPGVRGGEAHEDGVQPPGLRQQVPAPSSCQCILKEILF